MTAGLVVRSCASILRYRRANRPVLALIGFGVAGVLRVARTDLNLMYVFWPSSVMLTVGWRTTIPGVMITAASVVINCLLYMALAYTLLRVARLVRTLWRKQALHSP